MKDHYFTTQSLESVSLEIYQQVSKQTRIKRLSYQPPASALLVLDMQEYFFNPASHAYIPSAEAILSGIIQLINAYSFHGRPTLFTQHINTEHDAGMMAIWWREIINSQNPFHRIIPEIDLSKGLLIEKHQYDAFYGTQLNETLRGEDISQVVICGVMTHLCCETTARSAFMNGFQVFFPVDGTATYSLEFHRASLLNLAHGFASIMLVKDILQAMGGEHES